MRFLLWLVWFLEGVVVGFGAILPGISGGTLCVAFGMYRPIIETLSRIYDGLKKYGVMLGIFIAGAGTGFVGLSGLASWMATTIMIFPSSVGFAPFLCVLGGAAVSYLLTELCAELREGSKGSGEKGKTEKISKK